MMSKSRLQELTLYLNQTLAEYEVIPADFGWHIHKGDKYCGYLEYQEQKGWQGNALNHIPTLLIEELKHLTKLSSASTNLYKVA